MIRTNRTIRDGEAKPGGASHVQATLAMRPPPSATKLDAMMRFAMKALTALVAVIGLGLTLAPPRTFRR